MNENSPANGGTNSGTNSGTNHPGIATARRRLVGRAFAAPVVMTLFSGSAFAAASNMRCITNKTGGVSTPEYPVAGPADAWLRVQRYTVGGTQFWISGTDVVALKGANPTITTHLTTGQFQLVSSTLTVQNSAPTGLVIDTGKFVAVRINTLGNIVGIVGDGVMGMTSAITQTCWSSFRG